jgi:carbon monoxide dehydrogenase subunit G
VKLLNELSLSAPVDETWRVLLDVPRLARAVPGAAVEADPVDGGYRGTMNVQLGPAVREYVGVARLQDVDEDERIVSFHLFGREAGGQGQAEATITIRAVGDAVATRLLFETELHVAGRGWARAARENGEDVAATVLGELGARLEAMVGVQAEAADASRALRERAVVVVAGAIVGLALIRAVRRR